MSSSNKFKSYFSVFRDLRRLMHSQASLADVLDLVVCKTSAAIDAKGALLRLFNPETEMLEVRATWGLGKRFVPQKPIAWQKLVPVQSCTESIHVITDILNSPFLVYGRQAWDAGIRMILDVPLCINDQSVGLIRIYLEKERRFSGDELDFIITITEQCACVIDRVRLMENQKIQYNQLTLHMEKMSSLGRMAAGIAHEINNPLAGILLYSSNLIKKVPAQSPMAEGLGIIVSETQRCKAIIQGLLEFGRDKEPQWAPADVNEILEKSLTILNNEFYIRRIRIEKNLENELSLALLDGNQIEQVLINVLLNAVHAVDKDGVIRINTRMESSRGIIRIEIKDNGCGIDKQQINKIFDPFFSTKSSGTGLGLAVSYGIIQSHQGDIRVESWPGRGTHLTIDLPILPPDFKKDKGSFTA